MLRTYVSMLGLALLGLPACAYFRETEPPPPSRELTDQSQPSGRSPAAPAFDAEAGPMDITPPSRPVGDVQRLFDTRLHGDEEPGMDPVRSSVATSANPAPDDPLQVFEEGLAMTLGAELAGHSTATGERFDPALPMAAHPSLPLPSLAEIVNMENGKRMIVRVNDRQPDAADGEVAVSQMVAEALGFAVSPAHVSLRYLGPAPLASEQTANLAPAEPPAEQTASLAGAEQPPEQTANLAGSESPVEQTASLAGAEFPADAPVATRAAPEPGFIVQVGAFSDLTNAERVRASLADAGVARVEEVEADGRAVYRVRLGPWADRAVAEAVRQRLAIRGFADAVITAR